MVQAKNIFKKIIFTIILCSIIVSFCAIPSSYAKLELKDGEFYYAGTTKGSYVPQQGIFDWIVNLLGEIADWLLGIITMAFRMVFVGYTALIEHLLTNVLESASGVKVNGDDVSATDMSTLTDSSNNITVQGIVYNMVAALDVNFFVIDNSTPYLKEITKKEVTIDTDGKKKEELVTKTYAVSPTGLALKCKKCGKPVRECCTGIKALEGKPDSTIPDNPCTDCECGGNCDACREYAALVTAKDPIIVQLKNLIAIWYYIIRFLASAAMLIVLIGIGIKLAISNISSEKALYKRVLTDWVVGVIMIFAIHYIMIFAININEILIDTIRASANSINSVELKQLSEKSDKPILKSDDELEIDLYEEIRSRAYDAKLTVGLSGMILYMALVYLTFKYTLVYLKRFLTLAVLTLMGPAVGVSYALQKTLSGKAHSFKSWLSEYILNLIIQPVHAIIYAVFVSAALSITLENVAGIIIAIILMNFSLKAEMIFRRIFNLDPGGQGLLGATENAGDINQLNEKRRAIIGGATGLIVGGKPAAKLVTAIPRAVVGAGLNKAVATVLPKAAQRHKNKSNSSNNNNSSDSYEEGNSSSYSSEETSKREQLDSAARNSTGSAYQKQKESATSKKSEKSSNTQNNTQAEVEGQQSVSDQGSIISDAQKDGAKKVTKLNENAEEQRVENGAKASTEMEKEVEDPLKKSNNTADKIQEKNDAREKSQEDIFDSAIRNISTLDVIRGHKNELLNVDNYFDIGIDENGNEKYTLKEGLLFGTKYKDPLTGKTIRDTSNMAYKQLTPEKLLGFTDKDKQFFKEKIWKPFKTGLFGMPKMFFGAMMLIEDPLIGMGAITSGAMDTFGTLEKFKPVTRMGRYTFSKYADPTLQCAYNAEKLKQNRALREKLIKERAEGTLKKYPGFLTRLKHNAIKPKTIATVAGVGLATATFGVGVLPVAAATTKVINDIRKTNKYGLTPYEEAFKGDGYDKKFKEEYEKKFKEEYGEEYSPYKNIYNPLNLPKPAKLYPPSDSIWVELDEHHYTQLKEQEIEYTQEIYEDMNKAFSNRADKKVNAMADAFAEQEEIEFWKALGFIYNPKNKTFRRIIIDESNVTKEDLVEKVKVAVKKDDSEDNSGSAKIETKEITQADIITINKEIEQILVEISNGSEIDIASEKTLDYVMTELSDRLVKSKVLPKGQNADILFKHGKGGLKKSIKNKTQLVNKDIRKATAQELELTSKETNIIIDAVDNEIAKNASEGKNNVDISNINEDVIYEGIKDKLLLTISQDKKQPVVRNQQQENNVDNSSDNMSKNDESKKVTQQSQPEVHEQEQEKVEISAEQEEKYKEAIRVIIESKAIQKTQISQKDSEKDSKESESTSERKVSKEDKTKTNTNRQTLNNDNTKFDDTSEEVEEGSRNNGVPKRNEQKESSTTTPERTKPIQVSERKQDIGRTSIERKINNIKNHTRENIENDTTVIAEKQPSDRQKKASKKDIAKKLEQIKNIDFDEIDTEINSAEEENNDARLQLLLVKKDLAQKSEAINVAAKNRLGSKVKVKTKTNSMTMKATTERASASEEYIKANRDKKLFELRNNISSKEHVEKLSDQKKKDYDLLKNKLDEKYKKFTVADEKLERKQKVNGPINDANKTFNKGLDEILKKYEQ